MKYNLYIKILSFKEGTSMNVIVKELKINFKTDVLI